MTASILPSQTTQSQVKVDVRLCGSIPRPALSEKQHVPNTLQSLPMFPSAPSKQGNSSMFCVDGNKDENDAATKLCSDLGNIRRQQQNQTTQPQHNFYPGTSTSSCSLRPTTVEAPSWAVPAKGEARLEVSMGRFTEYLRLPC